MDAVLTLTIAVSILAGYTQYLNLRLSRLDDEIKRKQEG